jgi:hypothetical protein
MLADCGRGIDSSKAGRPTSGRKLMAKLRKALAVLLFGTMLVGPAAASAKRGAGGRRSHSSSSHKAGKRPKTVHVRSYTRKNGTVVRAHDRSAPN